MDKDSPWPYPPPLTPPPLRPFSPAVIPYNQWEAIPNIVHHCQPSCAKPRDFKKTDVNVISPRKGPSDTTKPPSLTSWPVWSATPPPSLNRAPCPGCHGDAPSPPCRWRPRHPSPLRRPGTWRGSYPLASVAVGSADAEMLRKQFSSCFFCASGKYDNRGWEGKDRGRGAAIPSCSRRSTRPGFVGMSCVGSGEAPMCVVMRKAQDVRHRTYKA
jgi:hypothetical protein